LSAPWSRQPHQHPPLWPLIMILPRASTHLNPALCSTLLRVWCESMRPMTSGFFYNFSACCLFDKCWPVLKLFQRELHHESKKRRHQTLGHNFNNYYPIFKKIFTSRLGSKFAINSCFSIPPRFKHVATLPCEIWMQKNGIILKHVLQLTMNHKVV